MSAENYKVRDLQPTVLRLNPDLRARLMKDAKAHGRSLSKEIEILLQQSLGLTSDGATLTPLRVTEPQAWGISDSESALIALFRKLPPEKQLALLSLLK